MTPLEKQYQELKTEYPGAVIWFTCGEYIDCFSECAIKTADIVNTTLTYKPDNKLPLTGFPKRNLDKNIKKMITAKFRVVLVDNHN